MENMDEQGRAYQERRREKMRKRTIRNVTVLIILVLLLIGLFAVKIFIAPQNEIRSMDYIEVTAQGGELYRIDIAQENCRYDAGGILVWSPVECVLVMKNGERKPVFYDSHYDVFMLQQYSGCYVISE